MKKICCLDAGHGLQTAGKETPYHSDLQGVYANHYKEAEQNYRIMFELARMLEYQGIEVVITNKNINFDMNLSTRVSKEKAVNADLFVSIHKNASPKFEWNAIEGIETFCYKFGGNGEKAARAVQNELITTGDYNRGVKEGNFQVLRETKSPAILCEIGFMTNLKEAKRMLDIEWHNKYATCIAKGICKYFNIQWKEKEVPDLIKEATIKNIKLALEDVEVALNGLKMLIKEL